MRCLHPYRVDEGLFVPCGKCLNCQITYRQQWGLRCVHELPYFDCATFLTLTYDDDHLPSNGSLVPKDLQDFWKRLRYYVDDSPFAGKIKYFASGEYGDETFRPHYHAIIFGIPWNVKEIREFVFKSWKNCRWSELPQDDIFQPVNKTTVEYVAGYVHKKYFGQLQKSIYQDNGLVPPFSRTSGGIGARYALNHREQLLRTGQCNYYGRKIPMPKYYWEKLTDWRSISRKDAELGYAKWLKKLELRSERNERLSQYEMTLTQSLETATRRYYELVRDRFKTRSKI